MKAAEWIDRVKAAKGFESDYRAAKELGLTRSTVSFHRKGSSTLDEETASKVAQALGVKLEGILVDQLAERTKDEAARAALLDEAQRLFALCKVSSAEQVADTTGG